jgi:predicted acylesterase/phospholipase RssA
MSVNTPECPPSAVPDRPFEKIALSCSGGGYRAASFHLGTMSYLNHLDFKGKPLLENVKLISTVSGGTITGIVYALMKQEGKSFAEIYTFLLDKLQQLDLLKLGIEKLNPDLKWDNPQKSKNLINAFAELYDTAFTGGAVLSVLDKMNSHLEAVVFNSTEFSNAINFRFKNPGGRQGAYAGNFAIRIYNDQLREIKLSDIMASSSCFPGGFEPMLWPDDYIHSTSPHLHALAEKNRQEGKEAIGIMDGGIYDNQGIESILNYKNTSELPYFDLVIISDVASPDMKPYVRFKEKPKSGWEVLTLKEVKQKAIRVNKQLNVTLVLLLIAFIAAPLVSGYGNNWLTGAAFTLAGVVLGLMVAKRFLIRKIEDIKAGLMKKIRELIPGFYVEKLSHLKLEELSVHRAGPLIMARLNSLLTLLMDVFLKVVRRLNYDRLYTDEKYKYRRISNLIKGLTEEDYNNRNYNAVIGPEIKKIAEAAAAFGTTLWFTDQEKLDDTLKKLVATGQFTLCYNMITYMDKLMLTTDNGFNALDERTRNSIQKLYEQCQADWAAFKKDPMFMVN